MTIEPLPSIARFANAERTLRNWAMCSRQGSDVGPARTVVANAVDTVLTTPALRAGDQVTVYVDGQRRAGVVKTLGNDGPPLVVVCIAHPDHASADQ